MKNQPVPKINIRAELKIFRRIIFVIFILGLSLFGVIAVCYMDDEVTGVGTVEGIRDYAIKTLVDAKASAIFHKAGDFVQAGDKLMEFDARDRKNAIALIENEIRELEDMNPYEGGDEHRVPMNMVEPGTEPQDLVEEAKPSKETTDENE